MDEMSNFSAYGGYGHEVNGVYEDPVNNVSDQFYFYSNPESTSHSGYYCCNSEEYSYSDGFYYYDYYPVYYLHPNYMIYYPEFQVQDYSPDYMYYPYYIYLPVNSYYYVESFNYTLPAYTYNVGPYIDTATLYESHVMPSSVENTLGTYEASDSSLYNTGKGYCINTCDSYSKIVGEEITTGRLFYEVYPAMLNNAGVDDEDKSVSSNEKLENSIVSNEAAVNENKTVYEESYSIETSHCEDDVDRNLIKKISSMSIDEVKEDIDENYENAKAIVYNEVLKGYIEIKSQLEELEWECHSLDDIPEEDEEAESESSEMELNENVLKDHENINVKKMYLTVVEEKSSSSSEESQTALNEEALGEESRSLSEESQTASYEDSLVEECGSLSEESQTAENEEALVEECRSLSEEPQTAENEEELVEQCLSLNEESQKAANEESLVEESGSLREESQTAENEEALVEECLSFSEESQTATNEEALVEQCLSLSEESQTAANEEPLVEECRSLSGESQTASNEGTLVEERRLLSEESQTAENEEALVEENPTLTEESQPSIDSSVVEESQKVVSVPDLILSNNEIDSAYEDPDKNISSEDLMEERVAAPKTKQRKKRFSRLRKFFGRICCCITKPP